MAETEDNMINDSSTEAKKCCCCYCNCKCNHASSSDEYLNEKEVGQQRIAYYQVLLDHNISSGREIYKQILGLSSLGIGLIAILDIEIKSSLILFFSTAGYLFFLVAIIAALLSMNKAPDFLNKLLDTQETPEAQGLEEEINRIQGYLVAKEKLQKICFFIGVTVTIFLVLLSQDFVVKFIISDLVLQLENAYE